MYKGWTSKSEIVSANQGNILHVAGIEKLKFWFYVFHY